MLIEDILNSKEFKDKLNAVLEGGKQEEWQWNREDEVSVEWFDVDSTNAAIIELLKEELINKFK